MLGSLKKMVTELDSPVQYQLPLDDQLIDLNPFLGSPIKLHYQGKIFCQHCQRETKKSFNQGYCYPCFISLAQCDMCIMKPETCHHHLGTCREPEWGDEFCFQPHVVYLANSSGTKVGITRKTQIPTRWIDQGAIQALPILQVSSRYQSGLLEVVLAEHVSDKTSWQKMLKNQVEATDLQVRKTQLLELCQPQISEIIDQFGEQAISFLDSEQPVLIDYPVLEYPEKVKSFNLDKMAEVSGILMGIKGQYLILDNGVINIRKFSGYQVEFTA